MLKKIAANTTQEEIVTIITQKRMEALKALEALKQASVKPDMPMPTLLTHEVREGKRSMSIAGHGNAPYHSNRKIPNAYADWVKQIDWQLFCTFTFAWKVDDIRARKIFDEFINRTERHLGTDVCYVRGDEKRFSGCGLPGSARHFHVLMTSLVPMHPLWVKQMWQGMAGNRSDDAGAMVEPYNGFHHGARYVLKFINQPEGDWAFRNLHLFHPEARSLQDLHGRQRRNLRRHKARFQHFVHAKPIQASTKIASECINATT